MTSSPRGGLTPRQERALWQAVSYAMLVAGSLLFLLPVLFVLSSSLKTNAQLLEIPPRWIPDPVRWANYPEALASAPFGRYFLNTFLIAGGAILGNLLSCTLVAYGFARLDAPGKKPLFLLMLSTMMLVEPVRIIPLYMEFKALGWVDSFLPLIVPAFFGSPFYIFLLRQFIRGIPRELDDAAVMDGANRLQVLWHVIVPNARPALAAVAVFNFQGVWNDFLMPLVFLQRPEHYTVALGLSFFRGSYTVQWGYLMAAAVVALLPMALVFFLAQKTFIEGVTFSGIRG